MSLQEVEQVISKFSESELKYFRAWFDEFDSKLWDSNFEKDVKSGKLDSLGKKALGDFLSKNYTEL